MSLEHLGLLRSTGIACAVDGVGTMDPFMQRLLERPIEDRYVLVRRIAKGGQACVYVGMCYISGIVSTAYVLILRRKGRDDQRVRSAEARGY